MTRNDKNKSEDEVALSAASSTEHTAKVNKQTLQQQLSDDSKSTIERYQDLAIGTNSYWYLIKYELVMLFTSWVPGALGLLLRKICYPSLLGSVGRNVIFGQGVSIRHGQKINIGDNAVIDDHVTLDAKGEENKGICIGENTIVSRNTVLSCKNGDISVGANCTVGINSLVHAIQGSNVTIGDDVLIGAYCYFIGAGEYQSSDLNLPFKKQGVLAKGGIKIDNNVWFGSNVQIMDGITIETGSIIGAASVVNKDVRANQVVAGVPIRVISTRS